MLFTVVNLDKSRNILLGFQALQKFKQMTGKSLAKIDMEKEDMEDIIPIIFYCGLTHEDKELTLEKTTELIDKGIGVKGAVDLLPKIFENTFGKEEPDIKNAVPARKKTKQT